MDKKKKPAPQIFVSLLSSASPSVGAATTGAESPRSKDRNAAADRAEQRKKMSHRRAHRGGGGEEGVRAGAGTSGAITVSERVVWTEEERFSTRSSPQRAARLREIREQRGLVSLAAFSLHASRGADQDRRPSTVESTQPLL